MDLCAVHTSVLVALHIEFRDQKGRGRRARGVGDRVDGLKESCRGCSTERLHALSETKSLFIAVSPRDTDKLAVSAQDELTANWPADY